MRPDPLHKLSINVDMAGRGDIFLDGHPLYPRSIRLEVGNKSVTSAHLELEGIEVDVDAEVAEVLLEAQAGGPHRVTIVPAESVTPTRGGTE